jgi:hypothetical protein
MRVDDLKRLHVPVAKVLPFLVFPDHRPTRLLDRLDLKARLVPAPRQLGLAL